MCVVKTIKLLLTCYLSKVKHIRTCTQAHVMYFYYIQTLVFSGSVLFYCFMQIAVLWICHVSMIFWNVRFPDQYMLLNRRHQVKYIHLVSGLVAIVVPVIPVAAIFGTGGFVNARFPPLLCLPSNANAAFYSLVLPVSVLIASGVTLLLAVFWTLHKVRVISHELICIFGVVFMYLGH